MKSYKVYSRTLMVVLVLAVATLACSVSGLVPKSIPSLQPLSTLEAAATSLIPSLEAAVTQVAPTFEAAITQVAPTIEAAGTSLVPTLEAAVTQMVPTLEAVATQAAAGTPAAPVTPSNLGTPDEAKAMLAKAVAHYNSVGRTQALADFTNRVSPFFDRDLYVACIDSNLKQSANGGFPNLVGSTTQPLSRAAWDAATTTTIGTVNYTWIDPATNQPLPKTLFYEKVGVDVCGVGAYNP